MSRDMKRRVTTVQNDSRSLNHLIVKAPATDRLIPSREREAFCALRGTSDRKVSFGSLCRCAHHQSSTRFVRDVCHAQVFPRGGNRPREGPRVPSRLTRREHVEEYRTAAEFRLAVRATEARRAEDVQPVIHSHPEGLSAATDLRPSARFVAAITRTSTRVCTLKIRTLTRVFRRSPEGSRRPCIRGGRRPGLPDFVHDKTVPGLPSPGAESVRYAPVNGTRMWGQIFSGLQDVSVNAAQLTVTIGFACARSRVNETATPSLATPRSTPRRDQYLARRTAGE